MVNKIKTYIKKAGWMFLPPTWIAYDKQKHGALAIWITFMTFFVPQGAGVTTLVATFISIALNALVAFGIEYYQKWFTTNRVFDIKDATIMIKVNIILLILLSLRMWQVGTYTF